MAFPGVWLSRSLREANGLALVALPVTRQSRGDVSTVAGFVITLPISTINSARL